MSILCQEFEKRMCIPIYNGANRRIEILHKFYTVKHITP